MALPHVPRLITLSHDEVIAHEEIKRMCKQLLPSWSKENSDDISVTTISGGISNLIVKVSSSGSHDPILFKVFGEKTELLVDREQELKTLINLNALGFGAQVLGTFGNGRIEKFLKSKTLEPEEMGHVLYVPRIAHKLRKFHNIPTAGKPTLWTTIFGWLDMASKLVFEDERKQAKFSNIDLIAMRHEIEVTKEACDAVQSPIVFSHNDLLSGNILVLETSSDAHSTGGLLDNMQFIDFEYAASGYRGYDFGNHFNEYAGFECDYTRYPDSAAQRLFFKHYLGHCSCTSDTEATQCSVRESSPTAIQEGLDIDGVLSMELAKMEAEANLFSLASHMYWGVWSLIQARYSPIDFDYLEYSATRWREYYKKKDRHFEQANTVFGLNKQTDS